MQTLILINHTDSGSQGAEECNINNKQVHKSSNVIYEGFKRVICPGWGVSNSLLVLRRAGSLLRLPAWLIALTKNI